MSPLERGFRASQIVSIAIFVVVSSVGIMRVDCICNLELHQNKGRGLERIKLV